MTAKSDFDEQDWARIVRAPFVAGAAITLADPGGPIEAAKESMASLKAATNPPSREQLLSDVALDLQAMVQEHQNPLKGFKPEGSGPAGDQVVDELRTVQALVAAKAEPGEAEAFGRWMVEVAQAAANAAKEGGFMGFGAEQVSQREASMIDQVRAAVTLPG
ncbi:hypothetical protein [Nocardioides iriomotensis]|uniref:Uncharacterized protein n=1 Tax=Nocardioides iriomotensis TaxID=715784 RepID=A0A4Q5IZV1_9ACTN|nr:hypothetical protein [Nocardioides iriomotensis]RYU11624.1 hypothetical protein ETU37_13785 [Nocardioides iriomotensis]